MTSASALYVGSVIHRRLRPKPYRLQHSAFWMLLDLNEIDGLHNDLRLFSRNRINVVSFFDRDHGEQTDEPLRVQVERYLSRANIALHGGSIRLLCMPRVLGYGFNPLSVYFCHRADGELAAILYEVRNTFGERHSYLIPVDVGAGSSIRQNCDKGFYVSPFMDMAMRYAFRVTPPTDAFRVAVAASDRNGPIIIATMAGCRKPLADATLARLLVTIPFLTLKVIAAIHWHGLKMWFKGFVLSKRPPRPTHPVTIVSSDG